MTVTTLMKRVASEDGYVLMHPQPERRARAVIAEAAAQQDAKVYSLLGRHLREDAVLDEDFLLYADEVEEWSDATLAAAFESWPDE
ncbi:hypothetical protein ACFTSF_03770 [Kribbella sp. NPDC056951]|uniref:hypothetical protein n=1 Tax=Kribbella sp. NPDC056951 TaxID=3345978 RepID=UPI0036357FDA